MTPQLPRTKYKDSHLPHIKYSFLPPGYQLKPLPVHRESKNNYNPECHPKQESVFLMHEGGHMRLRLFSAISKFVVRKKSQNLKSSYKKKLKPLSKAKVRKHRHTDDSHDENHQRITELPIQFRHELEIHPVDSSDHRQRQHDRSD